MPEVVNKDGKKVRWLVPLFALTLLLMPVLAAAVPDSVMTGPYNISFDLGFDQADYHVQVATPLTTESLNGNKTTMYTVKIDDYTGGQGAVIYLYHTEEARLQSFTAKEMRIVLYNKFRMENDINVKNFQSAIRKIDGVMGVAGSADMYTRSIGYVTSYMGIYYPSFDPRHLCCVIGSAYPWDKGSMSLLKTIHVERTN